jgi:hypothetical protein
MANIATKGVVMKEEPNVVFHDSKFFVLIMESSFINLCDYFNKDDPSLPVVVPIFMNSRANEKQPL